jgi:hypothetical protein
MTLNCLLLLLTLIEDGGKNMRVLKNIIATVKRLFVRKNINWEITSIEVEEISSDDLTKEVEEALDALRQEVKPIEIEEVSPSDILTSEEIDELLNALRKDREEIDWVLENISDIEF